jgi:uncharacterized membrane protein
MREALGELMTVAEEFDRAVFSARLRPHRSLTPRAARVALVLTGSATGLLSLPFFLMRAWPVVGFMGLVVTPLHLQLAKISARGARAEWRFNPLWVRLEKVEHPEFGLCRLSLASAGRRVEVAGFLGPDAKAEFARELSAALAETRRGPRFS